MLPRMRNLRKPFTWCDSLLVRVTTGVNA
jgi:hypothetical protein